jgi:hypothetical protein
MDNSANNSAWENELNVFAGSTGGTPKLQRSQRDECIRGVKNNPTDPESWWSFLVHEEQLLHGTSPTKASRNNISILELYRWATKVVPKQGNYDNESFVSIWVGYARQQWYVPGVVPSVRLSYLHSALPPVAKR